MAQVRIDIGKYGSLDALLCNHVMGLALGPRTDNDTLHKLDSKSSPERVVTLNNTENHIVLVPSPLWDLGFWCHVQSPSNSMP